MTKRWGKSIQGPEEQRSIKRQAVVSTGARLFHLKGYEYTSLNDIAKELGVSKPSLYYYVKNKEDILAECVNHALEASAIAFHKASLARGMAVSRVIAFFESYIDHVLTDFGRCATSVDLRALNDDARDEIRRGRREIDARVRALVLEGIEDGSIKTEDPAITVFFLFGAVNWMSHWSSAGDGHDQADAKKEFLRLIEKAIT